jgi:16S rRNA (adenine1518-N6/adenine1519-N6)-dimethyltransferase
VHYVIGDCLARKNLLNPDMLAAWDASAAAFKCTRRKLVANLPYVIATPLVTNLLIAGLPIERMVVMVQWEIAERLTAAVGASMYSSLAILVQSVADVEIVRRLAPTVFFPRPTVESAIVKIVPNAEKRARVGDVAAFRVFLRDLYTQRRKNLRGALSGWPSGKREKADVDRILGELGMDGKGRAEDLDIEQHLRLCAAFPAEPDA